MDAFLLLGRPTELWEMLLYVVRRRTSQLAWPNVIEVDDEWVREKRELASYMYYVHAHVPRYCTCTVVL